MSTLTTERDYLLSRPGRGMRLQHAPTSASLSIVDGGGGTLVSIPPMVNDGDPITQHFHPTPSQHHHLVHSQPVMHGNPFSLHPALVPVSSVLPPQAPIRPPPDPSSLSPHHGPIVHPVPSPDPWWLEGSVGAVGCSGAKKMIAPWSAPPVPQEAQPTFTYPSTPAGFPPLSPISPSSAPPGWPVLRQQPPSQDLPDSGSGQLTHIEGVASLCWPQMVGYYKPVLQPRRRRYVACTCLNCTSGANTKASNGDGSPKKTQHACRYPNCAKVYGRTFQLRAHLLSHTGKRPFVCHWLFCGKGFIRSSELTRHVRTHTGEKRFACPQCSKRFTRSDHLSKHIKTHQKTRDKGEPQFACLQCSKRFTRSNNLSKHIRTHQNTRDKEQEHSVGCAEPVIPEKPKIVLISSENVKAMLRPVAKKWKEIGEALGLSEDILDEVDTNNETDDYCMENAIDLWVKYHGPSWEKLATVLRGVGEEALGNYCRAHHDVNDAASDEAPPLPPPYGTV